jgi:hypothetical protein
MSAFTDRFGHRILENVLIAPRTTTNADRVESFGADVSVPAYIERGPRMFRDASGRQVISDALVIIDNLTPRLAYVTDSEESDAASRFDAEDNAEGSSILRWVLDEPGPRPPQHAEPGLLIKRLHRRNDGAQHPYHCRFCNWWHMGHRR